MSNITKFLAIPLGIIFMVRIIIQKYELIVPLEFYLVGLWMLFSIVSGIFAVDFNLYFESLLTCLQVMGIAFVLFNLLVWLKSPTLVWSAIFFATLIMSVYVLQNPEIYYIDYRLAGRLGNANYYSLALLISYIYALHKIIVSRSIVIRLLFLTSVPFIVYLIGETGSRIGIISAVTFVIVTFVFHYKVIFKKSFIVRILMTFMFLGIIFSSAYYFSQSRHIDRLEKLFSAIESENMKKADKSYNARLKMYHDGWKIVVENPVLGVGLNNFRVMKIQDDINSWGTYSHSNMVELLASTGFIGFLIYYSIYVSIFVKLIKSSRRNWKLWTDEYKEIYITTLALGLIYVMYDFTMVSYNVKLSWVILSSIIISTSILAEQTRQIKFSEV